LQNKEILEKTENEIKNNLLKKIKNIPNNSPLQRGARGGENSGVEIKEGDIRGGEKIQVSIMAPTEILARQHFNSMQKTLFEY